MIDIIESAKKHAKHEPLVVGIAFVFPFIVTLIYFVLLAEAPPLLQQGTFGLGKCVQFLIPIVWVAFVLRQPWRIRAFSSRGLLEGIVFGLLVFVAMMLLYQYYLKLPGQALAPDSKAVAEITAKIKAFKITSPLFFTIFGGFYALIHSGLEEYYWRWFVFGRMKKMIPNTAAAILVSSIGFALHHYLLLGVYFGYTNPLTFFGTFCVGFGGAYWAWSYSRFDSIWPAWISHGIIDAAIFTLGFLIVFR